MVPDKGGGMGGCGDSGSEGGGARVGRALRRGKCNGRRGRRTALGVDGREEPGGAFATVAAGNNGAHESSAGYIDYVTGAACVCGK